MTARATHPAADAQKAAFIATSMFALGSNPASTRSNVFPHMNQYVSQATAVTPKNVIPSHIARWAGRTTTRATMLRMPMTGAPSGPTMNARSSGLTGES